MLLYMKNYDEEDSQGVLREFCQVDCDFCTSDLDCTIFDPDYYCDIPNGVCRTEELNVIVLSTMEEICDDGYLKLQVTSDLSPSSIDVVSTSSLGSTSLL